jgi:hypothetical protein
MPPKKRFASTASQPGAGNKREKKQLEELTLAPPRSRGDDDFAQSQVAISSALQESKEQKENENPGDTDKDEDSESFVRPSQV